MEPGEVKKRYEWISTSRVGRVETYLVEDENNNTYFESGRIVPTSDIQNLLKEIDEETFNYKNSQQPEIESPKSVDHFIEMEKLLGNENPPAQQAVQQVVEQNPIKIILDKQKKKETVTLLVDFDFEIPTKKVLELLDLMFDREEVIDEIIKSSTEKINIESITEAVKTSIKEKISSYFDEEVEKDDAKNEKPISR
jgi:hypothetical protein